MILFIHSRFDFPKEEKSMYLVSYGIYVSIEMTPDRGNLREKPDV